jgi:glycosyltransferase involved in cell wall biosynthesis
VNRKLHVCLLSAGRIFGHSYGGEELFTISLSDWLANEGHDVSLLGIDFAGLRSKRFYNANKKKRTVNDYNKNFNHNDNKKIKKPKDKKINFRYLLYSLRLVIWILQVLSIVSISLKKPVTLIHAQDTGYTGLAAVVAGRLLRIPVIISIHGIRSRLIELEPSINAKIKDVLLKFEYNLDVFVIRRANNISVVNPSIKSYCKKITNKRVDVFPPAIKSKDFEYSEVKRNIIRKELGIDQKIKVIGYVGRLSPEKNLLNLVTSFADLANDDSSLKLVIVGEGPTTPQLKKCVSETNIDDKVIFCGPRNDIGRILSSFDIFVLPSYTEGLSTALIEAMTSGRAIICSDIPENHELLTHGKEALFVDPYDIKSIRSAIQLLCADVLLRSKLGYNAKIRASQYDENIVFPAILTYYEEIISDVTNYRT